MNTDKHTVTIPMVDYLLLKQAKETEEDRSGHLQQALLELIKAKLTAEGKDISSIMIPYKFTTAGYEFYVGQGHSRNLRFEVQFRPIGK